MKIISIATLAALSLAPFVLSSAANATTMAECSTKYKAAQTAGTLNGMKWNDFRKAQCGSDSAAAAMTPASTKMAAKKPSAMSTSQEPTADNTENMPEPAKTTAKAPKGVVFPSKVDTKYSTETAGKGPHAHLPRSIQSRQGRQFTERHRLDPERRRLLQHLQFEAQVLIRPCRFPGGGFLPTLRKRPNAAGTSDRTR